MKMVLDFLGLIMTLSLIRTSYTEETVEVTNATCNTMYDIAEYKKITLEYENGVFVNSDIPPTCMLTFFNTNPEDEICVKTKFEGRHLDIWQANTECDLTLRLYLKKEKEFSKFNGHECRDFHYRPLCFQNETIYAVYFDTILYTLSDINIVIYGRNIKESRTTTRRTTVKEVRTTTYVYDYDLNNKPDDHSVLHSIGVTIGIAIVVCTCCACCCYFCQTCGKQQAPENRYAQQMQQLNGQPSGSTRPRSQNTSFPVVRTYMQILPPVVADSHTNDAPSYNSVIQNESLPSITVDDRNGHSQRPSLPLNTQENHTDNPQENSPSPENENLSIPETPPPAYCDIDPPPYPGV